jgi:hypothetical protein
MISNVPAEIVQEHHGHGGENCRDEYYVACMRVNRGKQVDVER